MRLVSTASFIRAAKRLTRRNPKLGEEVRAVLALMESDIYHPQLRTHKLRGILAGSWACSVAYDVRIIFEIARVGDEDVVLLQTVGTHDEVY